MAAGTGARPPLAAVQPISVLSRLYGLGSIYGKTIRDSRLAFIVVAGILGGLGLFMGAAISNVFPTPASRQAVDSLIGSMPPEMVNLFGKPVGLGTLGGYLTWKYGSVFTMGTALWSILALSGTLAGEASRGSLDFVGATAFARRRIALEKVLGHLTMLALAMIVVAVGVTVSSNVFGDASQGDQIPPIGAIGFVLWVGLLAVFFGGLAFALAPILGRAGAAGVAGIVMVVLWVASGMNLLGPVADLSPYRWTVDHIPLVGQYAWGGLALVGVVGAAFLVIGIEVFVRRDVGITAGLGLPTLPADVLGVRGPISRAFGDQLPRALAWGIGLGLFGVLLASLAGPFAERISADPNLFQILRQVFPNFDVGSAGGFLQLYAELFFIVAGLAAATFVSKWASDETGGRLEMVLSTPLARAGWVVAGAIASVAAIVVMIVLYALGIGLGASAGGVSPATAMVGTASLGLYAAAIVGIGVAIGGLWRTSLAAEIAALVVIATYLVDLLAPPLNWPDWVHELALSTHFGMPMTGEWDVVGIMASVAILVVGTALGAWGMARRDVSR
ncbi:MAG: ABC transporter permease subunit [Chloroflexi bacterium]|nr:ABC transporter permease subunit [Chloroflexota bacterium]